MWKQYNRIIKNNGAIVLTSTQPFTTELIHSNLDMFKYEWIWDKKKPTGWLLAKKQPMRQHENVLVFYKKQPIYNPQPYIKNTVRYLSNKKSKTFVETLGMEKGRTSNNENSEGYPRSIINCIPVLNNLTKDKAGLHPTQKPVALFEYLIKTYTNENDLILDNCIGSGTTAIACINTNRRFIGFELDTGYFNIANERISSLKKVIV